MDINTKISCIGTGAMGGAIIGALAKKYKNISVTDKNAAFGKSFAEKNNCTFVEKNTDVIKDSKYIFSYLSSPYFIVRGTRLEIPQTIS